MIFDFRKILTPLIAVIIILFAVIGWKIAGDIIKPVWCVITTCEPNGWEEQEKRKELEDIIDNNKKTHEEEIANKEDNHEAVVDKMEYDNAIEDMVDKITTRSTRKVNEPVLGSTSNLGFFKPKPIPEPKPQETKPKPKEPDLVAEKMAKDLWALYLF